jgi:hypothetical protein
MPGPPLRVRVGRTRFCFVAAGVDVLPLPEGLGPEVPACMIESKPFFFLVYLLKHWA